MSGCLICKAPPDPKVGYAMGMMGWVCSNQCRNEYNSLLKTIFKGPEQMEERTYVEQAVDILMNKATVQRDKAGDLYNQSKECVRKSEELEGIAKEISMLVPEGER